MPFYAPLGTSRQSAAGILCNVPLRHNTSGSWSVSVKHPSPTLLIRQCEALQAQNQEPGTAGFPGQNVRAPSYWRYSDNLISFTGATLSGVVKKKPYLTQARAARRLDFALENVD